MRIAIIIIIIIKIIITTNQPSFGGLDEVLRSRNTREVVTKMNRMFCVQGGPLVALRYDPGDSQDTLGGTFGFSGVARVVRGTFLPPTVAAAISVARHL